MKAVRRSALATLAAVLAAVATGCIRDARDIHAARETPARHPAHVGAATWALCPLVGPSGDNPGVYGSDLGLTVQRPGERGDTLAILFGDTWATPVDGCRYAEGRSDDLIASLPRERPAALRSGPPAGGEAAACKALHYELADARDPTSWSRIRLFPNAIAESEDAQIDMGPLRTPVAAWSSGETIFGMFLRADPAYCARTSDCPHGMACSSEPPEDFAPLGVCAQPEILPDAPPTYCRSDEDCVPAQKCKVQERGVCMATRPFTVATAQGAHAPAWYRDDPRLAVAHTMYVGAAVWPDRPSDFAVVQRFATHRFVNVTAQTVAHFDPDDPGKNDYRPGTHTLLLWGRPWFFGQGGAQRLPFLLYQPLDALRGAPDAMRWQPRFFAGFGPDGKPRWSEHEHDAQPIYGTEAQLLASDGEPRIRFAEPEFDYVNQMSVSWVEPLARWVMLYGGDLPAFLLADPHTGETPDPVHLQPSPGAIHLRTAPHPWGRARGDRPPSEGWTSPLPLLTRRAAAAHLACGNGGRKELPGCIDEGDRHGPLDMLASLAELRRGEFARVADRCIQGELQMAVQHELSGNPIGRLYAPNVIDEWTEDVTAHVPGRQRGERAVEIYWNVSTWSPYQVVLFKSRLLGRKGDAPRTAGWLRPPPRRVGGARAQSSSSTL